MPSHRSSLPPSWRKKTCCCPGLRGYKAHGVSTETPLLEICLSLDSRASRLQDVSISSKLCKIWDYNLPVLTCSCKNLDLRLALVGSGWVSFCRNCCGLGWVEFNDDTDELGPATAPDEVRSSNWSLTSLYITQMISEMWTKLDDCVLYQEH